MGIVAAALQLCSFAQAVPTAIQQQRLSVFGAATETDTDLGGGSNTGVTAGVDLRLGGYRGFYPSIEVRATYPFSKGDVVGETNVLAGVRFERLYGRFHPYANILFGRGRLDYVDGGLYDPTFTYIYYHSSSNVISPGAGVDMDLGNRFAVKVDAQLQRYSTPVTTAGSLWSVPVSVGVVYKFDFNLRHKRSKK